MPNKKDPNTKSKTPIYDDDYLTERFKRIKELIRLDRYLETDDYDDF